jgi:hypothetical protein
MNATQKAVSKCSYLLKMVHPQPVTQIKTDKTASKGDITRTSTSRKRLSKAIDTQASSIIS